MPVLRSSPASPFGRQIKIAASVLGLSDKITVEMTDTNDPGDTIRKQNPLGKIPALVLDNGDVLYDSRVILDYLNELDGGNRLIPAKGEERYKTLTLLALANGLMDAALLQVYEGRFREEAERSEKWLSYQAEKVSRALAVLEALPPATVSPGDVPDAARIAVACALGYLDLRFEGKWRDSYPTLVKWLDDFAAAIPAFEQTRMKS
ncbi:glutathione S-transferase family protein [Rhizobiales bacterium]|uniref:glutathione S-transferase family protein n=1 Tax=Hongsoonwoonella zoysiae TaxID=2821844 RepID=UPI00155F955C|nr:glutathione S-transferase family protein [Hongsoonwoonella zoysiae]NRG17675.1 glutathione S-transferase family protein [Hongsoonwoonella zoysiae]